MDFGIPPKISEPDVLAEFELLLREASRLRPVSQEAAVRSKCELEAVAREFAASKPDMREFSLDREHRKVLRELRMDKRLVITKPDKGRATVILTKDMYVEKMANILNDRSKFVCLGPVSEFDRTADVEQSIRTYFFFFFFFFLYSEPKSPSHRVNKEQTGDGTGRTQPTSGLGILMCPAHQMKIYRRERERERERERA